MDKYTYLTFDQRREIEKLHNADVRVEEIAAQIGRSVAAVYEELKRETVDPPPRNNPQERGYSTWQKCGTKFAFGIGIAKTNAIQSIRKFLQTATLRNGGNSVHSAS